MIKLAIIIDDAKGKMLSALNNPLLRDDLHAGHLNDYRLVDNDVNENGLSPVYSIKTYTGDDIIGEVYAYDTLLEKTQDLALLSETFETTPMLVEMYFGLGSDSGTWFTDYVSLPITTPEDKVDEVAIIAATTMAKENNWDCAFIGIYSYTYQNEDLLW